MLRRQVWPDCFCGKQKRLTGKFLDTAGKVNTPSKTIHPPLILLFSLTSVVSYELDTGHVQTEVSRLTRDVVLRIKHCIYVSKYSNKE